MMSGDGQIVPTLNVGSEWNECHEVSHLLSRHHLNRPSDKMESNFLCLPIGHHRTPSKARSNISPIEDQSEAGQTVLHPSGSTPDLRIGTSALPSSRPSTPRNQESDSMQKAFFRMIYLTTLFRATQITSPFLIESDLFLEEDEATV